MKSLLLLVVFCHALLLRRDAEAAAIVGAEAVKDAATPHAEAVLGERGFPFRETTSYGLERNGSVQI